ncbi:hypothetical protein PMIN01_08056 [Paraphaeosphaeria minitans]|uniref:Uncharacterized protein n=1 Tax=Paraphaeosphaeria minitans TaxID=565426 RepID=A0A9P6GEA5_9PLEO|nr:hypothetical protein PMIN01_08056 [Paraphaeosphaeria minitans]
MLLCDSLATSTALQDLVDKILSHTHNITELLVHPEIAQPNIFELQWNPGFDEIVTELAGTMQSKKAKEKLATAGLEIRKPLPGEPGITQRVLLTNDSMLVSNENRCFLLQRLPISEDAHQKMVRHIQTSFPKLGKIRSGSIADTKLRLWNDTDKSDQKEMEMKFSTDTVHLVYGGVGLRTEPPLSPFLMISLATQPKQDRQSVV